ncbi:hypothetical protein AAHC03_0445 [Spirometra sp. Aus1]
MPPRICNPLQLCKILYSRSVIGPPSSMMDTHRPFAVLFNVFHERPASISSFCALPHSSTHTHTLIFKETSLAVVFF